MRLSSASANWLRRSKQSSKFHRRQALRRLLLHSPENKSGNGGCVYGTSRKSRTATSSDRHNGGRHGGIGSCFPAVHGISQRSQERESAQRFQPALRSADFLFGRGHALPWLRGHRHSFLCPLRITRELGRPDRQYRSRRAALV